MAYNAAMVLDPQVKRVLERMEQLGHPELATLSPAEARALPRAYPSPPGPDVQVENRTIPGPSGPLAVRLYRPLDQTGLLGGLVYFHGGGFVLGDLDRQDPVCRHLCVLSGCSVVSVDYRLAPEHKFPAAVDDGYAATCWVHENAEDIGIDHRRIAVGGDSAGATLATVVARLAKERRNPQIVFQLLLYPVTDLRGFDTPSYLENAEGMFLTRASMQWFARHYVRSDEDRSDPRASPLVAKNLIGLPPALVVTAEHDPLRDEGEAYADALREAHCEVTLRRYAGMVHAFVSMHAVVDKGRQALEECGRALKEALATRL